MKRRKTNLNDRPERQKAPELSVVFDGDLYSLPVTPEEVQLIRLHIGELLPELLPSVSTQKGCK